MSKYEDVLRYRVRLDDGESYGVWSDAEYTTVSGITEDTLHVSGAKAVKFNKTGLNDEHGLVKKEVSSEGMDLNDISVGGILNLAVYIPNATNVDSIDAHLVSDSTFALTNSVGWSETTVSSGWNNVSFNLVDGAQAGDGVDWSSVKHVAAGVAMSSASNTLDDIRVDSVWINMPLYVKTL